jgi:hypothetical protein
MQRRSGTQGEPGNEPGKPFAHLDVALVISLSEWFCGNKEGLR